MPPPDPGKPVGDRRTGQLRSIAIPAQVPQEKLLQFRGENLFGDSSSGIVREMPMPTLNPLFDTPGSTRIFVQEFDIVVRLKQQCRGPSHTFQNQLRGLPKIG
jgi:hypothetical protein